mmetsp:Transcript_17824/g.17057  ORF Transcript_17824/g.17057 Transcript_17824/m.17057 type:complete len:114 (+) Transcript_17824:1056-1397(+)
MDIDLLRKEFVKEKEEKVRFLRMNNEVQERCLHYQKMMGEYEQLYGEYLERSIIAEKEKIELQMIARRSSKASRTSLKASQIEKERKRNTYILMAGILTMALGVLVMAYGIFQ